MRRPAFAVLSLLLLCPSLAAAAPHETRYNREVTTHSQTPRPWRRLSDAIIRKIWGLPENQHRLGGMGDSAAAARDTPGHLVARYGEDIVLRFTIHTADEASSLAEACRILFLDVWEFNSDWADVRIAKDVVSPS
jgi:extracellular matrix protein 14